MRRFRVAAIATTAMATVLTFTAPAHAASGPVSSTPVNWTPQIANSGTDGSVEIIRKLVPCGNLMYAVGTFTQIKRFSTVYARHDIFSFDASTGAVTSWNPSVSGSVVDSITLSSDCSTAYVGGSFSSINGTSVRNIAAISTSSGNVISGFAHSASGRVLTVLLAHDHLLAGGYFTSINGSTRRYLASLDPVTGRDDGYANLNVSGHYQYTDQAGVQVAGNGTRVWKFALSPSGTRVLVTGDFTSVGGARRQQLFMLDLGASSATVDPWYSPELNQYCATIEPFYVKAANWSPDESKVYIATTGYKPASGTGFHTGEPRAGLCDAVAAFPTTASSNVAHLWINYTGCDSLFSTAADTSTVYVGGHERWASNPRGCDFAGTGAIPAPGMGGFSPSTGALTFNPTRARGQGADDMVVTSAGLWIGSDNDFGSNNCGKTSTGATSFGHAGICFLPY